MRSLPPRRLLTFALLALGLPSPAPAADWFVSPRDGNDQNAGTFDLPFASLHRAQREARKSAGRERVHIHLRGGTHYLTEPLILGPQDSGTPDHPVTWSAWKDEPAIVSGARAPQLTWNPQESGTWSATVPPGPSFDQLFLDGQPQTLARYPNRNPEERIFEGYAADAIAPERVARWADPRGAFLHAMHKHEWGDFHYRILGIEADGRPQLEGGWQNNRRMGMHDRRRFVENVLEELDAPSEWFFQPTSSRLFFRPPPGLDLASATVELVHLRHLLELRGAPGNPARHIHLRGITFRHAQRTFMDNREPLLRSDWTIYRGGALVFSHAEDCRLENATLEHLGGNAIFVDGYNRRLLFKSLHLHQTGANGIAFVGRPEAVRSPLFEYAQRQPLDRIDRTPGPRTSDFPADCIVDDCLIHDTGRVEKQTAPVQIAMASRITVRHCSLYRVPRAGINIGDGCWGGHLIEFCDVFDTVRETGDHGSFNSWGRDRFWLPGIQEVDALVAAHPDLPRLDAVEPTTLRNNRWRCDHGWDIDLDDGSSHYRIVDNLCLNGGLKLREGFHRTVENNITVNNSFHPHVWYARSQDVFRRNLVMTWYKPIGMPARWGTEVDHNLLPSQDSLRQSQRLGLDPHSLAGSPRFVDPEHGDFSVHPDSPALQLGFRNFPMDRFGVRSPRLRAIARTPALPSVPSHPAAATEGTDAAPATTTTTVTWLGARWKTVREPGEVSAAGLPGAVGILLLDRPEASEAAGLGFKPLDVILDWHGDLLRDPEELVRRYRALQPGQAGVLRLFRQQQEVTLELPAPRR